MATVIRIIQLLPLCLFFFTANQLRAQGEANQWVFGGQTLQCLFPLSPGAGIDFNPAIPVVRPLSALSSCEGTATMSDANGNLLFYSDGMSVWDRNNNMMPNGDSLLSQLSSTHAALAIPDPGNPNQYYLFTADSDTIAPLAQNCGCFAYSIIDMTLNAGNGDVVLASKNTILLSPSTEKIAAVKHANGTDYWVMAHEWLSDRFFAYQVTAAGVLPPVISQAGTVHQNNQTPANAAEKIGQMKFSPQGDKLALTTYSSVQLATTAELFDFDRSTGMVSNYIPLPISGYEYGVEWSPDGTKLYIASAFGGFLIPTYVNEINQYDVCSNDSALIVASRILVGSEPTAISTPSFIAGMQLGPDGKIYIAGGDSLHTIDDPNIAGIGCNYNSNSFSLGPSQVTLGLPSFPADLFDLEPVIPDFEWTAACAGDTVFFVDSSQTLPTAWSWNFGDPASGPNNSSNLQNPFHVFTTGDTFDVQLIITQGCRMDSVTLEVIVPETPTPSLGQDTAICDTTPILLNAGSGGSYTWSTGDTTQQITVNGTGQYWVVVDNGVCTGTDTINIVQAPPPVVNLGPDTSTCAANPVTLDAGTGFLNYNWSTGAMTQTISIGTTGSYWVEVMDSAGCTGRDTVNVTVAPPLSVNLGNDTATCNGAVVPLNAGSGFSSYAWSTGATTQTIAASSSGSYQVTVTDALGCLGSDTIQIVVSQGVGISTNATDATCNSLPNGSATATGSGIGPFGYQWNTTPPQFTANVGGLFAGTYTVIVTDSVGCVDSATVTVNQPAPILLSMTVQDESCAGNMDGSAGVTAAGGTTPYSYVWNTTATTASISNLGAGTYAVTVTDANGCQAADSVTVAPGGGLQVMATGNPAFCEGEGGDTLFALVSGGIAPYYYTWWCDSTNTFCGLDSIFDDDPIANPNVSTWYYVQITDANGCTSNIDSIWVEVLPKPIVDAGPDIYLCGNAAPCEVLMPSISGAPGPYSYLWIPGRGLNDSTILNPCARPDTTTIYALVVTAGNGCSSNFTTTDTLSTVTVHVNPVPVADAGDDLHICAGDTGQLIGIGTGAGPAYNFEWSPTTGLSNPTASSPQAFPPLTTIYSLTVWSNNCPSIADSAIVWVHAQPTVDAGADRDGCWGDPALLDATASGDTTATYAFSWSPAAGLSDPNAEDPLATPDSTTWYYVTATSSWGCGDATDSVLVTVRPTPLAEAGPNLTLCEGDSLQIDGSFTMYSQDPANPYATFFAWWPDSAIDDKTLEDPLVWPAQSMWYYFTTSNSICATTDSVFITVIPEILPNVYADTSISCQGDSVQLHVGGGLGGATITWSPAAGLSDPGSADPWAAPDSSTTYTVLLEEAGCTSTGQVQLDILPTPVAAALHSIASGCAPLTVSFADNSSDAILYIWDFGDGSPVSNAQNPVHTYAQPGSYTVTLTAVSSGGCSGSTTVVTVEVSEPGTAEFSSDPAFPAELALPSSTQVQFTDQSTDAVSWAWSFGDGHNSEMRHPMHTFTNPGEYMVTLTVTDPAGCVSQVVHGPYVIFPPELFVPNVFSPNGDDVNDLFAILYTGDQPYNLEILDRWGRRVFASNNKNDSWDGRTNDGQVVPDGVYYYMLRVGEKEYAGNVTLVR